MTRFRPAIADRGAMHANIRPLLRGDERLIHVARISAGIYWKGVAVLILAGLMFLNPFLYNLGIFFIIVALIILANAYLTRYYLLLALTDRQVLLRRGILTLDTVQLRLNRIESVELEWPPMGRLLGYSVVVLTGTGSRIAAIPFVADGPRFRQLLDEMLMAREDRVEAAIGTAPSHLTD